MADQNPKENRRDRNVELPGLQRSRHRQPYWRGNAVQSHDGVESDERERRSSATDEHVDPVRARHDNARGRVAD